MATWLEVKSCENEEARKLDLEAILQFPSLTEAMKVAENIANDVQAKSKYWEYSIKLTKAEIEGIGSVFDNAMRENDVRSERRTIGIRYKDRCYSLTLFVFKE